MIINLNNITLKNFLSYGNIAQKFDFEQGINLILGKDTNTNRANGTGKTSLINAISYVLFGKINGIKKDNIINWKNKKKCEVTIEFVKNSNKYQVLRAIKPDKFEIYENDKLIEPPSDIKTYQKQFENDVIGGIDYNIFSYLLHVNLNNNIPLLQMTTAQKRTFLEKMFVLNTYTELNDITNGKIKEIEEKTFKNNTIVEQNNKNNILLGNQNEEFNLKIITLLNIEKELSDIVVEFNRLNDQCKNIDETEKNIINDISNTTTEISLIKENINIYRNKITSLETVNKSLNDKINELKNKQLEKDNKINDINNKISSLNVVDNYNSTDLNDIETKIFNKKDELNNINLSLERVKTINESLKESYEQLKNGSCPLCNQNISENLLNDDYVKKIEDNVSNIKELIDKKNILSKELNDLNIKKEELNKISNDYKDYIEKYNKFNTILETLQLEEIQSHESIINEINLNIIKKNELDNKRCSFNEEVIQKEKTLSELNEILETIRKNKEKLNILSLKIENIKKDIVVKQDFIKIINDNETNINKNKTENKNLLLQNNKFKELLDYLLYLKILCKDENVKQYAISSNMSYITQQVNYYLSQTGGSHYVKFNKWLEETIYGPGVNDISYGNLSGGEGKQIDLSIQFSFLDILKLKTGTYLDILLLDEILDSSVDSIGLNNIIKIIKIKQIEDSSKVYIITHRNEISNIEFDNAYVIEKKNGFSYITKI